MGTTAMYMQRTTSGTAGNGLNTTTKCMRGAAGIGLGTTIKHLRRPTSGTAGSSLGATMKYLRFTTSATPGHVSRSVCVWGPSLLAVFILVSHYG
jgi:hypothetical protein